MGSGAALKHLAADNVTPQQTTGGAKRAFHFWGPEADTCLQAQRARINAAVQARAAKRAPAAQAHASAEYTDIPQGFSKGQLGTVERQLTAIMGAMLDKKPTAVYLADENISLFKNLAAEIQGLTATVQGQHATLADARAMVLELIGQVSAMQATVSNLYDAATNPLAGPAAEAALTAAMSNGHDDANLRAPR